MSGKQPRIVTLDNRTTRGVVIRDYEEDSRGRRVKSKPYRKPPTKTSNIVEANNRLSTPVVEQVPPELFPADEDFEGIELDEADFGLDEVEGNSQERQVSGASNSTRRLTRIYTLDSKYITEGVGEQTC